MKSTAAKLKIFVSLCLLCLVLLIGVGSSIYVTEMPPDQPGKYSPWCDFDDDGDIDIYDIVWIADRYGMTGTPVNKTALLYNISDTLAELESRIANISSQVSGSLPYDWLAKLTWEAEEDGLQFLDSLDYTNLHYGTRTQNCNYSRTTAYVDGLDAPSDSLYFATSVDDFNVNGSPNSSIWSWDSYGAVGDHQVQCFGGQMRMWAESYYSQQAASAWARADQTLSTDYASDAKDKEILLRIYAGVSGEAGKAYWRIALSDGSSIVDLYRRDYPSGFEAIYVKIAIRAFPIARADVYFNGALVASNVDLISLPNWYLQFHTYATAGYDCGAHLYVQYVRHIIGEGNSASFVSEVANTNPAVSRVMLFTKDHGNGGTFTYQISADNGLHYETIVPGQLENLNYSGNQLVLQIVGTEPSNPDAYKEDNTPILEAWAVVWNPS